MQNLTEIHFKWIGERIPCPDSNLFGKKYQFYSECKLGDTKYEIGIGAILKLESRSFVGVIHYFYEVPHSVPKVKKYLVAVELFHKPSDIEKSLAEKVKFGKDIEVVKKGKVVLIHVPVYAIKSRCAVVYGLADEDPQDLFHEFIGSTPDIIYVCRYIAFLNNGVYSLKPAVFNEEEKNITDSNNIVISDDESPQKHLTAGTFSVAHVENIASNIKIKLRRELSSSEKNDQEKQSNATSRQKKHVPLILARKTQSPSELLKNLTLSPKKQREIPSREQVKNLNKNIKQITEELVPTSSDSEDIEITVDYQPVVVLNNIDMNVCSPSSTSLKVRRSSRVNKTIDNEINHVLPTPTRSSKRQSSKISYTEFYEFDEFQRNARTRLSKAFDDNAVASHRSSRKQNLAEVVKRKNSVTFDEIENKTDEKQNIVENTPSRKKLSVKFDESATPNKKNEQKQKTVECTPSRTRKNSSSETPKKNKIHEIEETNSVRQKRSVSSLIDVTPKKQSRITHTPKSGRLNIMTMTPTIEEREEPIVFCDTPMSRARMGLSAYSVPSKMPCRENEYMNIYSFVTGRLMDQSSGCMYISGVPGTGKTMTVCRVMSDLDDQKDDLSDFVFLKLNALALTEPRQIYVEIVKKLINKKLHWEESLKEIERFFKAKKKKIPHVILVDELDKLCNRKQDVVYNLLDLPFHSVTPLIVITIANTMDLPERILTNKVNSRLGLVRLTFKPYQYKDLVKIVTERLATDAVFKNEALELVARKVAAVSGDARRALAMCSRATEIAEEENKDLVTMDVVDRVINEMSSSSKVQAIKCCSKLEQLILTTIANEVTRTGNEEVPFLNMIHNLEQLCLLESFKLPSAEVCLRSCHNLGSFRLLITQHGRIDLNMTLMLNISADDIHYALRH